MTKDEGLLSSYLASRRERMEKYGKRGIERGEIVDMLDLEIYCEQNREEDRFCRCCCACSGPSYCNIEPVTRKCPEGMVALQGGCGYFYVKEE